MRRYSMLDTRCSMPDSGYRMMGGGWEDEEILDARYSMLDAGFRIPDDGWSVGWIHDFVTGFSSWFTEF